MIARTRLISRSTSFSSARAALNVARSRVSKYRRWVSLISATKKKNSFDVIIGAALGIYFLSLDIDGLTAELLTGIDVDLSALLADSERIKVTFGGFPGKFLIVDYEVVLALRL